MSKLNVDTLADELGTGGPNFVGMPSVGGDPVVESGSNSDGEWTRWADGTQQCAHYDTDQSLSTPNALGSLYKSGNGEYVWSFPIFFSQPPLFASGVVGASSSSSTVTSIFFSTSSLEAGFTIISAANTTMEPRLKMFATGRWK